MKFNKLRCGDNGNKCLVGALIDDCDYSVELDREDAGGRGTSISSLLYRKILPEYLVPYVPLLGDCQNAHDQDADVKDYAGWKPNMISKLKSIAKRNNLQYNGVL